MSKGDTLSSIAKKFNISVDKLVSGNKHLIKDKNIIKVGWKLTIPQSKNYAQIGKQIEIVLKDIEKLSSFNKLNSML